MTDSTDSAKALQSRREFLKTGAGGVGAAALAAAETGGAVDAAAAPLRAEVEKGAASRTDWMGWSSAAAVRGWPPVVASTNGARVIVDVLRAPTRAIPSMTLLISVVLLFAVGGTASASGDDVTRLKAEASSVAITRDDWGIAHVHGHSDADAVFGMAYTQAEDDFNRVETNYITSLGRRAQLLSPYPSHGASTRDRPFRAVDGAFLHRRQYRRRHRTRLAGRAGGALRQEQAHTVDPARPPLARAGRLQRHRHRAETDEGRPCAAADQPPHLLLLPLRTADGERRGSRCLWRGHLGPVLHLSGLQPAYRLHAYLDRRRQRRRVCRDGDAGRRPLVLQIWPGRTAPDGEGNHRALSRRRWPYGLAQLHHLCESSRPDRARGRRQMDRDSADEHAAAGAGTELPTHQGRRLCLLPGGGAAEGQFLQRHAVRRRQGRDRLSSSPVHAVARRSLRLHKAGRWRRSGDRLERPDAAHRPATGGEPAQRLGVQHE